MEQTLLDNSPMLMVTAAEFLNALCWTEQEPPPTVHNAGPTYKIRSLSAMVSHLILQVRT